MANWSEEGKDFKSPVNEGKKRKCSHVQKKKIKRKSYQCQSRKSGNSACFFTKANKTLVTTDYSDSFEVVYRSVERERTLMFVIKPADSS